MGAQVPAGIVQTVVTAGITKQDIVEAFTEVAPVLGESVERGADRGSGRGSFNGAMGGNLEANRTLIEEEILRDQLRRSRRA